MRALLMFGNSGLECGVWTLHDDYGCIQLAPEKVGILCTPAFVLEFSPASVCHVRA